VKVQSFSSHTLYDLEQLYQKNNKVLPKTYGSFLQLVNKVGLPDKPLDPPSL